MRHPVNVKCECRRVQPTLTQLHSVRNAQPLISSARGPSRQTITYLTVRPPWNITSLPLCAARPHKITHWLDSCTPEPPGALLANLQATHLRQIGSGWVPHTNPGRHELRLRRPPAAPCRTGPKLSLEGPAGGALLQRDRMEARGEPRAAPHLG